MVLNNSGKNGLRSIPLRTLSMTLSCSWLVVEESFLMTLIFWLSGLILIWKSWLLVTKEGTLAVLGITMLRLYRNSLMPMTRSFIKSNGSSKGTGSCFFIGTGNIIRFKISRDQVSWNQRLVNINKAAQGYFNFIRQNKVEQCAPPGLSSWFSYKFGIRKIYNRWKRRHYRIHINQGCRSIVHFSGWLWWIPGEIIQWRKKNLSNEARRL